MDGFVLIHSKGETKQKNIFIPSTGSYNQRRTWADKENYVYSVAENIEKVKKGDKVIIKPHSKIYRIDEITQLMEKKLNKKLSEEIKDSDGKIVGTEDREKYFIIEENDIICKIN